MPKRTTTRIAWYGLGLALFAGAIITGVVRYVPAPDKPWFRVVRDLGVLIDVVAFVLWMVILALLARRHSQR